MTVFRDKGSIEENVDHWSVVGNSNPGARWNSVIEPEQTAGIDLGVVTAPLEK